MGAFPGDTWQAYQSRAVFISSGAADSDQTVSGSLRQLSRVQSLDWTIPYPVEMPTYLDYGDEAYTTAHNPVDISLSWLHTNGINERNVGLVDLVGPNGALALNLDQEKNLYIATQNTRGIDSIGAPTGASQSVLAFGQALMTTYTMNARVGGLIQSQATLNCLTAFSYTGSVGNRVPAVAYQAGTQLTGLFTVPAASAQYDSSATGFSETPTIAAIGARDMYVVIDSAPFSVTYSGAQSCYLQGFDVTLAFDRRELKPLGCVYPPTRALHYPIRIDLTTEAIVNSYQRDQLDRIHCLGSGQSVYLIVKQPCSSYTLFGFYFDKLQIESQSFSTSIGSVDTATTKWRGLITTPTTVFCSPVVGSLVNADTNQPFGGTW